MQLLQILPKTKFILFTLVGIALTVLIAFLLFKPQKVNSYPIPTFRICVRVNGQPLKDGTYGVIEYGDQGGGCSGGNKRFLEIGKSEFPSGNQVAFLDSYYYNCATFYPWWGFSTTQKDWLYNQYISVPTLGQRRRAPFSGAHSFGCMEDPLFFNAYIDNYDCNRCLRYENFSNNGGLVQLNINCVPENQTPTVEVRDLPSGCFEPAYMDTNRFQIYATDPDGGTDINQMKIDIGGNVFTVNVNGTTVSLENRRAGPLSAQFQSSQVWQDFAWVRLDISGLKSLSGHVPVSVWARDRSGATSGWVDQGGFDVVLLPEINELSFNPDSIVLNPVPGAFSGSSTLVWDTDNGGSSNAYCTLVVSSRCLPSIIYCVPGATGSYTVNVLGSDPGACVATLSLNNTECGGVGKSVNLFLTSQEPEGDAWMNTAFGDTYAYNGYKSAGPIELRDLSDSLKDKLNIEYSNPAYFSHFLISKYLSGGYFPTPSGRESLRNYLLSNYDDANRDPLGTGNFAIYDYLEELALKNSCTIGDISTGCPDSAGDYVYFVDGPVTINSNWNRQRRIDRTCIVIASGNITVQAGVNELDAFFFTEGKFITESAGAGADSTLIVNGGVIANTVDFNRSLSNNSVDPAEIVSYDPKYLDRLKGCFGQDYPFQVREYKYSTR